MVKPSFWDISKESLLQLLQFLQFSFFEIKIGLLDDGVNNSTFEESALNTTNEDEVEESDGDTTTSCILTPSSQIRIQLFFAADQV